MRPLHLFCLMLIAVWLLPGCGGGGGTSGGSLGLFLTDNLEDNHDRVFVTIYRVEALDVSGNAQVLFEDNVGRTLDLKRLRDGAGERFAFLTQARVNAASHNRIRVTIHNTLVLFPKGADAGQETPVADGIPRDSQGRPLITFNLPAPRNLGAGSENLVIDFDLKSFTIAGGKVVPSLREGSKNGLVTPDRHEQEDYTGTISNLSGVSPGYTFTLTLGVGHAFTVVTNADTVFFNSDASANPALANGKWVEVRGVFDIAANRLTASVVKIKAPQLEDRPEVKGAPSAINAVTRTFKVSTFRVEGFLPMQTTVHVETTPATIYRGRRGILLTADDFFTQLPTAPFVEVEGTYNPATNTLTARRAKLENDLSGGAGGQEAEAKGVATAISPAGGSFTINPLQEWEGFVAPGTSMPVVTTTATAYRDLNNAAITKEQFFAALPSARRVKVKGSFANGVFTAVRAELED